MIEAIAYQKGLGLSKVYLPTTMRQETELQSLIEDVSCEVQRLKCTYMIHRQPALMGSFDTKDVAQIIHLMPCPVLTLRASKPENLATGKTICLPLTDGSRTYPSFSAFQYEMLCTEYASRNHSFPSRYDHQM